MRITEVKLYILEDSDRKGGDMTLVEVPNLRRIQYRHEGVPADRPARQAVVEVVTDEGLVGRCTTRKIGRAHV